MACRLWIAIFASVLSLSVVPVHAGITYREPTNGELSGISSAPTDLGVFTLGANIVSGSSNFAGINGAGKPDVFTFNIANGFVMNSMIITGMTTIIPSQGIFLALDDGPTFRFSREQINDNVNFPDTTLLLGASVLTTSMINTDVLPVLDSPAGGNIQSANNFGRGFDRPLPAGQYSIYLQETGPTSTYEFTFNVSAVPEPSSILLLGIGLTAIPCMARRVFRG